MKKMVMAWVFLISVLLLALLFFGYTYIDSISGYRTKEADMVEASDFYLTLSNINLSTGEGIRIEDKQLIESKTLSSMKVDDEECKGYVDIKKNVSGYDFKAYIKCENYVTEGYEE